MPKLNLAALLSPARDSLDETNSFASRSLSSEDYLQQGQIRARIPPSHSSKNSFDATPESNEHTDVENMETVMARLQHIEARKTKDSIDRSSISLVSPSPVSFRLSSPVQFKQKENREPQQNPYEAQKFCGQI